MKSSISAVTTAGLTFAGIGTAQRELLPICRGFIIHGNHGHLLHLGQGLAPAAPAAPAEEDPPKNNGNTHFPPVYLRSVRSPEQSLPCPEASQSQSCCYSPAGQSLSVWGSRAKVCSGPGEVEIPRGAAGRRPQSHGKRGHHRRWQNAIPDTCLHGDHWQTRTQGCV